MRTWLAGLLLGAAFMAAPFSALAAEATFLGPIVPPECNCEGGDKISSAADWGCVLQTFQNGINFVVTAGVFFLIIAIAYAGFMFILTPANPENRQKARKMLSNGVMGLLVVLSAWLVVDFVMKILYNPDIPINGKALGPWNEILKGGEDQLCLKVAEKPPPLPGVIGGVPDGGPSTGPTGGTGTCQVPTSGNCAPSALSIFGSASKQAAQICNAESRGVIRAVSTSDIMRNDPKKRAFSFGLFQINLTWHSVAGLNCPAAFRGKDYDAVVINEQLYEQCVAAALTASANIREAYATYQRTGWTEWSTAGPCGLARAHPRIAALLQSIGVESTCWDDTPASVTL